MSVSITPDNRLAQDRPVYTFKSLGLDIITLVLLGFNAYHMFNWLFEMVYDPSATLNFKSYILGCSGVALAFVELPATVLFVNSIRLKDHILVSASYLTFMLIVAYVEVLAGQASTTLAITHRNAAIQAENIEIRSIGIEENLVQMKRKIESFRVLKGDSKKERAKKAKEKEVALADYRVLRDRLRLNKKEQGLYRNKTNYLATDNVAGGASAAGISKKQEQIILFFPLLVSLGAMILTIYSLLHIKGVVRMAAISMENKLVQEWDSSAITSQVHALISSISPIPGVISKVKGMFNDEPKTITKTQGDATLNFSSKGRNHGAVDITDKNGRVVESINFPTPDMYQYVTDNPDSDEARRYYEAIRRANRPPLEKPVPADDDWKKHFPAEVVSRSTPDAPRDDEEKIDDRPAPTNDDSSEEPYRNVLEYKDFYESRERADAKPPTPKSFSRVINGMTIVKQFSDNENMTISAYYADGKEMEFADTNGRFTPKIIVDGWDEEKYIAEHPESITTLKINQLRRKIKELGNTDSESESVSTDISVVTDTSESVVTDSDDMSELTDAFLKLAKARGKESEALKVGDEARCVNCGKAFIKNHYKQKFCSHTRKPRSDKGNCSDEYKNKVNPKRLQALKNKRIKMKKRRG